MKHIPEILTASILILFLLWWTFFPIIYTIFHLKGKKIWDAFSDGIGRMLRLAFTWYLLFLAIGTVVIWVIGVVFTVTFQSK